MGAKKNKPHGPNCNHCKAVRRKEKVVFVEGTDVPICKCHSKPMFWRAVARLKDGGHWLCKEDYRKHDRTKRLKRYGMVEEDYLHMFTQQGGQCAICKAPPDKRWGKFAVDHCHKTGEVRGLLCMICNTAIGRLEARWEPIMHYLGVNR